MKITKEIEAILECMNGSEISSNIYAETVGVRGTDVIAAGMVIDHLDNEEKILQLWGELVEQEGV